MKRLTVLIGSKTAEMTLDEFTAAVKGYEKVHIDIGTGDGRNIYKAACKNKDVFYIGVDPVKENMYDISKKAGKKPEKGGAPNMLLVIASAEALPKELNGAADSVSVYFPWGSLLECVIKPVGETLLKIAKIAKRGAEFTFVTTYSDSYEEGEITRRELPAISKEYFSGESYKSELSACGFAVEGVEEYDNEYVKQFNSQWAKRLAFGRKRAFYRVNGHIE